jgi:L-ascorbate metabolism protein UlaG (beta-lactamase superfamily)
MAHDIRSGWLRPVTHLAAALVLSAALTAGCWGGGDVSGDPGGTGGQTGGGDQGGGEAGVQLTWFGHSAFLITSPDGVRVLTDPYPGNLGYGSRTFVADIITVSHEHFDHNSVASADGDPEVLRGLAGGDWAQVEKSLGDVTVYSLGGTYHDGNQGAKRGKNALFIIEAGGLRFLHLGDLGETPTAAVVEKAGRVDVLLIPVGGYFTIDAKEATRVAALFGARVVIPMHYKTKAISDWSISDESPFLEGQTGVKRIGSSQVTLDPGNLPKLPEIWVLDPAPAGGS